MENNTFSSLNIDPVEGAEIVGLLGVSNYEFGDPQKFQKIRDIVSYFQGKVSKRYQILKVISKKDAENKLEAIWTWVQLQQEREKLLSELNANDFAEDIGEQIKEGYLTKDSLHRILKDIEQQEVDKREIVDSILNKRMDGQIPKIKETVSKLDAVTSVMNQYE